jgi:hypothetical protein
VKESRRAGRKVLQQRRLERHSREKSVGEGGHSTGHADHHFREQADANYAEQLAISDQLELSAATLQLGCGQSHRCEQQSLAKMQT